jgi:ribosome-associated GTPase EngA
VLRRYISKKPIYLVANKADTNLRAHVSGEFYALGLGETEIFPISSQNGSGTGELLDAIVSHFDEVGEEEPNSGLPRIAILGRPNVGKSSFVNLLLGEERSIVTDQAGTTRDSIEAKYSAFGHEFMLVDTAGLRRKARVNEDVEFYSNMRTLRAMEASDVCVILLDASRSIEAQDVSIIALADKNRKGIVILVNKWDLIEGKETNTARDFEAKIMEKIAPIAYPPVLFHIGAEQAARAQGIGGDNGGVLEQAEENPNFAAQRCDAEGNRAVSAAHSEGQNGTHQVRDPAADAQPSVCLLLQPTAVHPGILRPLFGEPFARAFRFHGGTYRLGFPEKVKFSWYGWVTSTVAWY